MKFDETAPTPALDLLRQHHGRVTPARVAVLDTLLASRAALTHQEISGAMRPGTTVDRVTLYRTLDWLVDQGYAHRIEGQDRVRRFNATSREDIAHAHFHCRICATVYCLEDVRPSVVVSLPDGFSLEQAELTLQGLCPTCRDLPLA